MVKQWSEAKPLVGPAIETRRRVRPWLLSFELSEEERLDQFWPDTWLEATGDYIHHLR